LAKILKDDYEGDAPEDYIQLVKLPGIGPKMAHLYLQCVCDKVEGIAVDTHVHRICNRLKWVESKNPEDTRKKLEEWVPKDKWMDVNTLLVGLGQTICFAKKPKCEECLIKDTCDYYLNGGEEEKKSRSKSKKASKRKPSKSKSVSKRKKDTGDINVDLSD
jgi:endonuclease-3